MKPLIKQKAIQEYTISIDRIGEKQINLERAEHALAEAAGRGAQLVVLPECALTGYVFSSLQDALPHGEPVPGPSTERLTTSWLPWILAA